MPRALITGVQGQTGYYLAEVLLGLGWEVAGTANVPNDVTPQTGVQLHKVDMSVAGSLRELLDKTQPEVIINLAAISSVAEAWHSPRTTMTVNTSAVAEIAEFVASREPGLTRVVQASSSEIFGDAPTELCDETTPLNPINPYGVSKAASHMLGQTYRKAGFQWSNAVLYNHESPRRPEHFLSRKVSKAVARISLGLQDTIELGDLSSKRDWGWAPDYARALTLIATEAPVNDYVVASGISHSVEDFVREAFSQVGISDWQSRVTVNSRFIRPTEVKVSVGDSSRLRQTTGWSPDVTFPEMVSLMVRADLAQLTKSKA